MQTSGTLLRPTERRPQSFRRPDRRASGVRAAVAAAAALVVAFMVPLTANAADQTTWNGQSSNTTSCTSQYQGGYVNFCRSSGGTYRVKWTNTRDGDLRSCCTSGGLNHDRYSDGYIVGNLNGSAPNTLAVRNSFGSTSVRVWTGTCYSGSGTTILVGNSHHPSSSNNLRSMAAATVTSCA